MGLIIFMSIFIGIVVTSVLLASGMIGVKATPVTEDKKEVIDSRKKDEELSEESKAKLDRVIEIVKKKTEMDAYQIIDEECENADVFISKFGGVPYWDLNKVYPTNFKGDKLPMLAQINFDKENFDDDRLPKGGILQFFIDKDDLNGADFDHPDSQKNFRIVYHDRVNYETTKESILALNIPTSKTLDSKKEEYFPFENEYKITFKKVKVSIGERDYRFEETVKQVLKEEFNEEVTEDRFWKHFTNKEYDYLAEAFTLGKSYLLGYPHFTQEDPRGYKEETRRYDTLLLQIDSDGDIMWGDDGVCNFFINGEDLKKGDFSRILYNWDCY